MTTVSSKLGYGNIEYKMTKEMAKSILKTRKGADTNVNPQDFLCRYVNEDLGVKGNCVRVLTDL